MSFFIIIVTIWYAKAIETIAFVLFVRKIKVSSV